MKKVNTIIMTATILIIITLTVSLVSYGNKCTEHKFQLSEIQDGIYCAYNNVVSSIPAHNYDIVTLCCNGQIRTFKGSVNIIYTNSDPYVFYKNYNHRVNADILDVYIPFGSVEYQGITGVGSRR